MTGIKDGESQSHRLGLQGSFYFDIAVTLRCLRPRYSGELFGIDNLPDIELARLVPSIALGL